ncbi:uncharacterized protein LOC131293498 [Anopheles ziemanni]|uniref:uncharacterized protein LOC131266721 n=1 Tax=Anopheles coustani TaxID=139045 RepID=UPI00265B591F|nr:uncharacterized protein LOC131266721 [Anopheles coustani]XP_058177558.1 uncharacterized protein LOC131293498 [Anopheles ziemanni]
MIGLVLFVAFLSCECMGHQLNDTYGGLPSYYQSSISPDGTWNSSLQSSMYYNTSSNASNTSLATVDPDSDSLSSRMTVGMIGGIKFIIYIFRLVGEFLRKFGAEMRVAKCLLMYSFTFQPLSSKVNSGSIISLLTDYFGDEDARDVYGFLSRNVFAHLGLKTD